MVKLNKRGFIALHWIILVVVAAIGMFFLVMFDIDTGTNIKGVWQLSFVRATLDAEKDLLMIDAVARESVAQAVKELPQQELAQDFGCGIYEGYALWNKREKFCELIIGDAIKNNINTKIKDKTKITYDEIIYSETGIVGKTGQTKVISSSFEFIPTEKKSAGLFKEYDSFLIEPFYLRYEYNPGFRVKLSSEFGKQYDLMKSEAKKLLEKCRGSGDLRYCLEQNRAVNWKFYSCVGEEDYKQEERKVAFCVKSGESEYRLALDFTPTVPLSPGGLTAVYSEGKTSIAFNWISGVSSYKLIYTNWENIVGVAKLPLSEEDAFWAKPAEKYHYSLDLEMQDLCPEEKEVNKAYWCEGKVRVVLDDARLVAGEKVFFGVVSVAGEEKSEIGEWAELT